jgi:hypothetical protein
MPAANSLFHPIAPPAPPRIRATRPATTSHSDMVTHTAIRTRTYRHTHTHMQPRTYTHTRGGGTGDPGIERGNERKERTGGPARQDAGQPARIQLHRQRRLACCPGQSLHARVALLMLSRITRVEWRARALMCVRAYVHACVHVRTMCVRACTFVKSLSVVGGVRAGMHECSCAYGQPAMRGRTPRNRPPPARSMATLAPRSPAPWPSTSRTAAKKVGASERMGQNTHGSWGAREGGGVGVRRAGQQDERG